MSDAQVPPPPPPSAAPPPPAGQDSSNRTVMIILAYLGPLALIPFFLEQRDKEIRWHAKHGLVLLVAEIILWVVLFIINLIATAVFPPFGCVFVIVFLVLGIGLFVLHIACMIKGVKGERLIIPAVSEFADRF